MNEWDDAYRVIPQPTAWPYQEDMVDPMYIHTQQECNSFDIYRFNGKAFDLDPLIYIYMYDISLILSYLQRCIFPQLRVMDI